MKRGLILAMLGLAACTASPDGSYTKLPEGRYIRMQCYSAHGIVNGIMKRGEVEQRVRIFDMPCILEGLDEIPQPVATAEPQPVPSATTRELK